MTIIDWCHHCFQPSLIFSSINKSRDYFLCSLFRYPFEGINEIQEDETFLVSFSEDNPVFYLNVMAAATLDNVKSET